MELQRYSSNFQIVIEMDRDLDEQTKIYSELLRRNLHNQLTIKNFVKKSKKYRSLDYFKMGKKSTIFDQLQKENIGSIDQSHKIWKDQNKSKATDLKNQASPLAKKLTKSWRAYLLPKKDLDNNPSIRYTVQVRQPIPFKALQFEATIIKKQRFTVKKRSALRMIPLIMPAYQKCHKGWPFLVKCLDKNRFSLEE